jgi:molybdate transport system substrate-binding protein
VLPTNVLDDYQKKGVVRAEHRGVLGLLGINAVVRKGASLPDLSSVERLKAALLGSRKVAMATPGVTPSGTHMGKMLEQLGIADAMKSKLIHRPALEGGVELVERSEADLGFYPKSEVIGFAGLTVAAPLPAEVQLTTIYGAAVTTIGKSPDAAAAFIAFMTDPRHRAAWSAGGFDPAA